MPFLWVPALPPSQPGDAYCLSAPKPLSSLSLKPRPSHEATPLPISKPRPFTFKPSFIPAHGPRPLPRRPTSKGPAPALPGDLLGSLLQRGP